MGKKGESETLNMICSGQVSRKQVTFGILRVAGPLSTRLLLKILEEEDDIVHV